LRQICGHGVRAVVGQRTLAAPGVKAGEVVMTLVDENWPNQDHAGRSSWSWQDAFQPIPEIFDWYKNHAAAGTLILAAFLVVKGYVIARGSLATALGILQYAGLTSVIVAGLLSSLPILTALMLGWVVFRIARGRFPKSVARPHKALACVLAGVLVLSVFFTPVPYMLAAICLGLLAGLAARWKRDQWQAKLSAAVAVLIGAFATLLMLYTVWVPHEIVVLRPAAADIGLTPNERAGYILGYVLADDPGGWITILTSGSRTIVRFRDANVKSVTVCEQVPHGGFSDIFYASPLWISGSRSLHLLHPGGYVACP
jgi:hypothetical protein